MTINHRIYPDNGQETCLLPGALETGNFYESLGEAGQAGRANTTATWFSFSH